MSIVLMPQSRLKVYLQTTKYLFAASVVSCLCLDCTGSGLQIQFVTLRSWSRQPSSQSSDQDRLGNPSDRVSCAGPLFSTIKVSLDVKIPASEHGRCCVDECCPPLRVEMVETGEYRLVTDCYRYHGHLLHAAVYSGDSGHRGHRACQHPHPLPHKPCIMHAMLSLNTHSVHISSD